MALRLAFAAPLACGAALGGCGGGSANGGAVPDGGQPGDGASPGDAAGAGAGEDATGGTYAPPSPVAPEISRAWTWRPCGQLAPAAADVAAVFDGSGRIVVLGPREVRVYDAAGTLLGPPSNAETELLIVAPDGVVLGGRRGPGGIALTPVGETTPRHTFPPAPIATCGAELAFSTDGKYLLATGGTTACAWRTSDGTFAGSVPGLDVTMRDDAFVSLEGVAQAKDVVRRDLQGRELSRGRLGPANTAVVSPAGDRAIVDGVLRNLDTGAVVPWDLDPNAWFREPLFSASGDLVLVGDGVFATADGARRSTIDRTARLAAPGATRGAATWSTLSPDGRRVVRSEWGRATLFEVGAKGIAAVLGPPPLPDRPRDNWISHLGMSADGSLLVSNVAAFSAFGIKLAPRFGDSKVLWNIETEINLSVDVSPDGRLVAVGGDGRAIHDAADGRALWPSAVPPPEVNFSGCLPDRVRFSPKKTWIAGSDYQGGLQVFTIRGAPGGEPWRPSFQLPGACDSLAFSRDERLMATSAAALYRTAASPEGWTLSWSMPLPAESNDGTGEIVASDVRFSPDETQLLVSRCRLRKPCLTTVVSVATGAGLRSLPEITAPHPAFSPEGSWIVAGGTLLHLPSGDVRTLGADPQATTAATFTPDGDIIGGSQDAVLTRYCRGP